MSKTLGWDPFLPLFFCKHLGTELRPVVGQLGEECYLVLVWWRSGIFSGVFFWLMMCQIRGLEHRQDSSDSSTTTPYFSKRQRMYFNIILLKCVWVSLKKTESGWQHMLLQASELSAYNKLDGASLIYSGGHGVRVFQKEFQILIESEWQNHAHF